MRKGPAPRVRLVAVLALGLAAAACQLGMPPAPPAGAARPQAGSILPAGRQWVLSVDDEFDGPSLDTTIWRDWYRPGTIRTANGGMYEDNGRALSFAGGMMIIKGFDAGGLPGNPAGLPGVGGVTTVRKLGPGYFEARLKEGQAFTGFWTESQYGDCLPIGEGVEADILEGHGSDSRAGHDVAAVGVHWGGYGACNRFAGTRVTSDPERFHVVGMDWSTASGLTFYLDGKETYALPSANSATPPTSVIFSIESKGDPADPMEVDWFRYYIDAGPAR